MLPSERTLRMKSLQACALLAALLPAAVLAQSYPARPIQVISATGAGNPGDRTLRLIAPKMSEALGQPLVIETRAGASGAIAATAVARAVPDGHTVLFGTSSLVNNRFLVKNPPFDIQKDFVPISFVISASSVFAVSVTLPVNSVKEFVEYARRNPGKLSYVHTGTGLALHLMGASLNQQAGIDMLPVAYKASGSTMLTDFVTGRVPVYFAALSTIAPHVSSGKAKLLAVMNNARLKQIPDVPSINETYPDYYNISAWWAFLGPAGTPRPMAERLAAETRKALDDPKVAAALEQDSLNIIASTPDEMAARIRREIEVMGKLMQALAIQPE